MDAKGVHTVVGCCETLYRIFFILFHREEALEAASSPFSKSRIGSTTTLVVFSISNSRKQIYHRFKVLQRPASSQSRIAQQLAAAFVACRPYSDL